MTTDALTVNAGSTSVKLTRFDADHPDGRGVDFEDALRGEAPAVVLHRVVHGGIRTRPVLLDDAVVSELHALIELAPLHQRPALEAIERCRQLWPGVRQLACFDTSFHTTIPAAARTYALPPRLRDRVQVYGFHGLAHAWAAGQVRRAWPAARRVLVAHLGGGASLCAVREGRSVATTMGFTPLDGLVMATRSGTVDPGAVLWLAEHSGERSDGALSDVFERESGLLGLAGTADMREIERRARHGDAEAAFALDVWLHRFQHQAGAMISLLGGLDALVFSGGIGEGSAYLRQRAAGTLGWVGVSCTEAEFSAAAPGADDITADGAAVRSFVVHAREDRQMLIEAAALLA